MPTASRSSARRSPQVWALPFLLAALALTSACAGPNQDAPSLAIEAANDNEFTERFEVMQGATRHGFTLRYHPVPMAVADNRPWPPGMVLVEDEDFTLVGYVSPSGEAGRFDDRDRAVPLTQMTPGTSEAAKVGAILGLEREPTLRSATPGLFGTH